MDEDKNSVLADLEEKERQQEQSLKDARKEHKCHNCMWAKWLSDVKVVCAFPKCVKTRTRRIPT